MTRSQLEHVLRAAADVSGVDELVVVGSQAILACHPDAPAALRASIEADVYPRGDPARAALIDGALGDGSRFHETYGYYAHGVGPETAKAPAGWQERMVPIHVPATRTTPEVTGWCLEPHDLVLAKCVAGRESDWAFAATALEHRLVGFDELTRRLDDLPLDEEGRDHLRRGLIALGP